MKKNKTNKKKDNEFKICFFDDYMYSYHVYYHGRFIAAFAHLYDARNYIDKLMSY